MVNFAEKHDDNSDAQLADAEISRTECFEKLNSNA